MFGLGIQFPSRRPSERDLVRGLVVRLGERRAVRDTICYKRPAVVETSISTVRAWLTNVLTELPAGAAAARQLDAMRDACNRVLNVTQSPGVDEADQVRALLALRESLRVNLLALTVDYDLVEARDLANRIDFSADAVHPRSGAETSSDAP